MGVLAEIPPWRGQMCFFFCMLCFAAAEDVRKHTIPDVCHVGIFLAAMLDFDVQKLWGMTAAIPFFIAAWKEKMGGGDVKLVLSSGLVLGWPLIWEGCVLGILFLLCFHMTKSLAGKGRGKEQMAAYPMAPFLAAGFMMVCVEVVSQQRI